MNNSVQRKFFPGDEWLYYKVYTNYSSANHVLVNYIGPFVDYLLKREIIDRWFFIRYKDPEPHLRVRFHLKAKENTGNVIQQFQNLFEKTDESIFSRIEISTYERELERYGHNIIEHTEEFFYDDSQLILSLLSNTPTDERCFLFTLKLIDFKLDCFNFTLEGKTNLLKKLQSGFKKEFDCDKKMAQSLGKKYRAFHSRMENVMEPEKKDDAFLHELLEKDKILILPLIGKIIAEKSENQGGSLNDYIASLIHMSINRIFRSKQRVYEMLAYDFLYRYSNSKLAQSKKNI